MYLSLFELRALAILCAICAWLNVAAAETEPLSFEIQGTYAGRYYIHNRNYTLQPHDGFYTTLYPVEAGKTYRVNHSNNLSSSTICLDYCVYSTSDVEKMGKSTKVQAGVTMGPGTPSGAFTEITIADGGKCIAVSGYGSQMVQSLDEVRYAYVDASPTDDYAYHYDGTNLYIAHNSLSDREYVFWFRPCMANNLFTFYRVGTRATDRCWPSVGGIRPLDGVSVINATASDNIGPLAINPGGWVGGNHLYHNQASNSDLRTAKTLSVNIEADDTPIAAGEHGRSATMRITVVNVIFDPSRPQSNDGESLTAPLSTETVVYTLSAGNTIEVSVTQEFANDTDCQLGCYYGLQSMMRDEAQILTPAGKYADWTDADSAAPFCKQDWPRFNRFIERGPSGLQTTWLYPDDAGDHQYVPDNMAVFNRGSGKSYHKIVDGGAFGRVAGKTLQWHGSYIFMNEPQSEDDTIMTYCGSYKGVPAWFVCFKRDFAGEIEIPASLQPRNLKNIDGFGATCPDYIKAGQKSVDITATKGASLIYAAVDGPCIEEAANVNLDSKSTYIDIFTGHAYPADRTPLPRGIYLHLTPHNTTKVIIP